MEDNKKFCICSSIITDTYRDTTLHYVTGGCGGGGGVANGVYGGGGLAYRF